ncbi:isocitrate lyase/PEP mutase family protein [Compostimonas suwonensis]|uniref:2-methylisocitrate lyase n=1 Tax=Compostimonas suwonensis TaxID=1048394 RepID=A0A2M9BCD7_9MICO|nr:isocitrate lyase/phosphoenolpyruvate mutase family protein [Compostimonas suwonensis]PJJ55601.1 2-methylisocitrate lyase-like PEP mutase family enzyme [Compostimonas suwonensis]
MTASAALRTRIGDDGILVLPGAADALTARIIEQAGFDAVYATGAGFSNAAFGLADVGLTTLSEVTENLRRIADAVQIPVVVDADTGYGGVLNVQRTVRELERAGASAIQLEDQRDPKRCGHFEGNTVLPAVDMVRKIHAAVDARVDDDLVIIARTDAYQSLGLDEAADRANAYSQAGADVIFVEAPTRLDELRRLPQLIEAPLLANVVEGGKTPQLSAQEFEELGFRIALFANTALRTSMRAVSTAMAHLRREGSTSALADSMATWQERQTLVRLAELQQREDHYLSGIAER